MVTLHTGVWIETADTRGVTDFKTVTPHTGVWIETIIKSKKGLQV